MYLTRPNVDVKGFFDNVDHEWLFRMLRLRIKEWIKYNRHLPGGIFFRGLNARLRGHYNYYGVKGNYHSLSRFLKVGHGMCIQIAEPTRRQATELYLGAVYTGSRRRKHSASPDYRSQRSQAVYMKATSCSAEASTTEEPGAGKLHAEVCTVVLGNRHSYRRGGK